MIPPLGRLLSALQATGLAEDLSAEEVVDALWLACRMAGEAGSEAASPAPGANDSAQSSAPGPASGKVAPAGEKAQRSARPRRRRAGPAESLTVGGGAQVDVEVAGGTALEGRGALTRSLRRSLPRVAVDDPERIDEPATAARVADEALMVPIPLRVWRRRLEVALVVDDSVSMLPWLGVAADLARALRQAGAFRDVRVWSLDAADAAAPIRVRAGLGRGARRGVRRRPEAIADPTGGRLVLVFTDCVGPGWADGRIVRMLDGWSRLGPVALVQALPEPLWWRTVLGRAEAIALRPGRPFGANAGFTWAYEEPLPPGPPPPPGSLSARYPVLELDPEAVVRFAGLVGGAGRQAVPGVLWSFQRLVPTAPKPAVAGDAAGRIEAYHRLVSPLARQLTGLLAATAPLTPRVIRLVRRAMLPDARLVHEAEVLLGGILRVIDDGAASGEVVFDFAGEDQRTRDDVRALLLDDVPGWEAVEVLRQVATRIPDVEGAETLRLVLGDWQGQAGKIRPDGTPLEQVAAQVFLRVGADYARLVARRRGAASAVQADAGAERGPGAPDPGNRREADSTSDVAPAAAGRRWALVIGVSASQTSGPRYAAHDASAVAECLREVSGIPPENMIVLLDEGATRAQVNETLRDLVQRIGPGDLVVCYFAGQAEAAGDDPTEAYLVLHDAEPNQRAAGGLRFADLRNQITYRTMRLVLLLDLAEVANPRAALGLGETAAVLMACGAGESSREDAHWGGGVFARVLTEGLRGAADANGDGVVALGELFDYVTEQVSRETEGRQRPACYRSPAMSELPLAAARDAGYRVSFDGKTYHLGSGTSAGVTVGAVLAVYGPDPPLFAPLGSEEDLRFRCSSVVLRVTSAARRAAEATALGSPFDLPPGARARLVKAGKDARLSVVLVPHDAALASLLSTSELLEVAPSSADEGDVTLVRRPDGAWAITDEWWGTGNEGEPALPLIPPENPRLAVDLVEQYYSYSAPLRLVKSRASPSSRLRLEVLDAREVSEENWSRRATPPLIPSGKPSRYDLTVGDRIVFRVTNASGGDLFVTLLACVSSGRVQTVGRSLVRAHAQEVIWRAERPGQSFTETLREGQNVGVDRLFAIGTRDRGISFEHLEVEMDFLSIAAKGGRYTRDLVPIHQGEGSGPVEWWASPVAVLRLARAPDVP